ncbi:MAG: tetratricopeptide repeat protein [Kofleriaceae bacterium]
MGTVKDRGTASPPRRDQGKTGDVAQRLDEETDPAPTTRMQAAMDEANRAYDRQDYDEAKELANRLLAKDPGNVRMRRVLVSTACMQGDPTEAQKHFDLLPADGDARQVMQIRCKRENIVLANPAPAVK